MRRFGQDQAVSPIIGFIIATVVFSVSFYYVVESAVENDPKRDQATEYTALAQSLADIVLAKGSNWYLTGACLASGELDAAKFSPDMVGQSGGRFGLGDEGCARSATDPRAPNNLSFEKFRNVYLAKRSAATNDLVDYEEARRSLGLEGQNVDFHIRTWPVLSSVRQLLANGHKDPFMRPLYIGDYSAIHSGGSSAPTITSGVIDGSPVVRPWVKVANSGTGPAVFDVYFSFRLDKGTVAVHMFTRLLQPGQDETIELNLRKSQDWKWKKETEKFVEFQVWDVKQRLAEGTINMASITMTDTVTRPQIIAEADRGNFVLSGGSVQTRFSYTAYDGKGQQVAFSDWDYVILNEVGTQVAVKPLPTSAVRTGTETHTVSSAVNVTYKAVLRNNAGTTTYNTINLNVLTAASPTFKTASGSWTYVPQVSALTEARYVDTLIENFEPWVHSPTYYHASLPCDADGTLPCASPLLGDVYPDLKDVMNNDLPAVLRDGAGNPTLSKYTTLVVGSNVDQNAMTSNHAKRTISDWVMAGGTLIVMGSEEQNVNWLQPLFHASLESGSGGLFTPDEQHPALNVPNQLDYTTYTEPTTVWGYNAGADQHFTHVVTGEAGADAGDILGIGNPGSFGNGKVLLTAWKPYDLTPDQATACAEPIAEAENCQSLFLIHNLVTLTYRELYLDYGPPIPVGEATGAQLRVGSIWHPELKQLVGIQMQVFVFPGGN